MGIELALTPDIRREVDLACQVDAASAAGFRSLGIFAERADAAARPAFDAAGLRCHEVMALVITANEEATLASAQRVAAAAETVGASWVTTIFHSPLTSTTPALVARCAATIAEAGAGMAVEFHPFGPVTSICTGLEIVERAGSGAGLLIDSWHFFFGDSTWEDLENVPLDRVAYLQFDDAPEPESDDLMSETMNRRVLPGNGTFHLARFASAFLDRGFDGLVSVEVLSSELLAMPLPEFAKQAYRSAARYWR
jgi:sugar phosphate isomerase/epimerase